METILLTEKNFNRLKEQVKKNKEKTIIFTSEDDDLNRKVLEKLPIQIILINLENRKDFQKQRNSGFNQVMAKIAKKNGVQIGINLSELKNTKNKEKILARVRQNVELCKKNKIQMRFISQGKIISSRELKSLMLVLKAPTWMTPEI
ncbi:MAG: hypothetical protein KC516_03355 [Nanoarchaeota archaeon]|nr:hypothetical protein [Nanoarchaeota archaeon]